MDAMRRSLLTVVILLVAVSVVIRGGLGSGAGSAQEVAREGNFYVGDIPYQMYVEYRMPQTARHSVPIVLFHGGAHTGAGYVSTPDGRPGWAPYLVDQGWVTYVVDWPGHGRSPVPPDFQLMSTQQVVAAGVALLEQVGPAVILTHSMSGPIGWKIADTVPDRVAAIVAIAPGPPANIQPPVTEEHPLWNALYNPEDRPVRFTRESALENWGNSDLFPHEAFEDYFKSLVPESARAVNERQNVHGIGLTISGPERIARMPTVLITGNQDTRHPRNLDEPIAAYFGADFVWLADAGLPGHGHMQMLERGNLDVAALFNRWLEDKGL
jgi:pimeloyl-ACP methyl ester carboxylesterase